jgi:hypothetical protein
MTKADIVDQIAERTGLTKKDVAETVDSFLNAVARALAWAPSRSWIRNVPAKDPGSHPLAIPHRRGVPVPPRRSRCKVSG